jgi:hypothetical protein
MCNAHTSMHRILDTCLSLSLGVNDSLDSAMDVRWQRLCRKGVLEIREQTAGQHGGHIHLLYMYLYRLQINMDYKQKKNLLYSTILLRMRPEYFIISFLKSSSSFLLCLAERVWIQLARKGKPDHLHVSKLCLHYTMLQNDTINYLTP